MNFAAIKTRVAEYLDRNDLSALIDSAVRDAVQMIQNSYVLPDMLREVVVQWPSTATAPDIYTLLLPTNIRDFTSLEYSTDAKNYNPIYKEEREEVQEQYPDNTVTGPPDLFYIDDTQEQYSSGPPASVTAYAPKIIIQPSAESANQYYIRYRYNAYSPLNLPLTTIDDDSENTWLFRNHWQVILYQALADLAPIIKDPETIVLYNAKLGAAVHAMKRSLLSREGLDSMIMEPAYGDNED